VSADVVHAPVFQAWEGSCDPTPRGEAARPRYVARQRGKLRGRIVLIEPHVDSQPATTAAVTRYEEADLAKLAAAPDPFPTPLLEWPVTRLPEDPKKRRELLARLPLEAGEDLWQRQARAWEPLWTFLREEGVPACSRATPGDAAPAASSSPRQPASGARARRCRRRSW
jgi:hypothetical protein